MQIEVLKTRAPLPAKTGQLLFCFEGDLLPTHLEAWADRSGFNPQQGCRVHHPESGEYSAIMLLGMGHKSRLHRHDFYTTVVKHWQSIANSGCEHIALAFSSTLDDPLAAIQKIAYAIYGRSYQQHTFKQQKPNSNEISTLFLPADFPLPPSQCKRLNATLAGMALSKYAADLPGNIATPTKLADIALTLEQEHDNLHVDIVDEKSMATHGMAALLAVSQGSAEPATMSVISYRGGDKKTAPLVFIGKAVTFDTGGISLKRSPTMHNMIYDMCGGAVVLGLMKAIALLKPNINVIGIVAAVENMPGSNAYKPGDVVNTAAGKTVEIISTDAEGRMVLCDALHYAKRFKPLAMIDLATLTGAAITALGTVASAAMSNSDAWMQTLINAAQQASDPVWPLPLWDDYHGELSSPFADMKHIGNNSPGAITAGCFLSKFVDDIPWLHLDIAGTAFEVEPYKNATGRPLPALLNFVTSVNHKLPRKADRR